MPRRTKHRKDVPRVNSLQTRSQLTEGDDKLKRYVHYGKVTKECGNCRFRVELLVHEDEANADLHGQERDCHIPRKFKRNRVFVHTGDIVLIQIRDYEGFEKATADIVQVYSKEEVGQLMKRHQLAGSVGGKENGDFEFDYSAQHSSSDSGEEEEEINIDDI